MTRNVEVSKRKHSWSGRFADAKIVAISILAVAAISIVEAQPAVAPQFEVASIKRLADDSVRWIPPQASSPQRFDCRGSIAWLIQWAYDVRDVQIQGGPAWVGLPRAFLAAGGRTWDKPELFAIQATTARPSTEAEMKQMARALLADRFHLTFHRIQKEIPIYALVVAKNGPKPMLAPAKNEARRCEGEGCFTIGSGLLVSFGGTMDGLSLLLTNNLDRPVMDKTGLSGRYDFRLNYEQTGAQGFRPTGPEVYTPLQDLGLKIESSKETLEVLVIDSMERPSEN